MRVKHPGARDVKFKKSEEKSRRIQSVQLQLHDLTRYLSAYEISPAVIGMFEAMLVRSFANDLLNVRMEQFAPAKKKTK
jgi:hypothetical protein